MTWDTELYEAFRGVDIEAWPDVAPDTADDVNGYVVWRNVDDLFFNFLDVRGYVDAIVSFDFRACARGTVQRVMRDGINALWQSGLLITVDRCEWFFDYEQQIRGTVVTAVLRTDPQLIEDAKDRYYKDGCFYGADMVWDTELVKTFQKARIEAWPDIAPDDSDMENGHVVWRQSDELVTDYLDTGSTSEIEVELNFRARSRSRVQEIMRQALTALEDAGQVIRSETAQWYFDDAHMLRGSVITALLYPNPGEQPVGEFNAEFSAAFDVLQEA